MVAAVGIDGMAFRFLPNTCVALCESGEGKGLIAVLSLMRYYFGVAVIRKKKKRKRMQAVRAHDFALLRRPT